MQIYLNLQETDWGIAWVSCDFDLDLFSYQLYL